MHSLDPAVVLAEGISYSNLSDEPATLLEIAKAIIASINAKIKGSSLSGENAFDSNLSNSESGKTNEKYWL